MYSPLLKIPNRDAVNINSKIGTHLAYFFSVTKSRWLTTPEKNYGEFFSLIAWPRKTRLASKNAPGSVLPGLFSTDSMIPHMEKAYQAQKLKVKS